MRQKIGQGGWRGAIQHQRLWNIMPTSRYLNDALCSSSRSTGHSAPLMSLRVPFTCSLHEHHHHLAGTPRDPSATTRSPKQFPECVVLQAFKAIKGYPSQELKMIPCLSSQSTVSFMECLVAEYFSSRSAHAAIPMVSAPTQFTTDELNVMRYAVVMSRTSYWRSMRIKVETCIHSMFSAWVIWL